MTKTTKAKSTATKNLLEGYVVSIGKLGALVTDISNAQVVELPQNESVSIRFGPHETLGIFPTKHDQPNATLVASLGASGFLEIEIVGISLSEMLGVKAGAAVSVTW